MFDSTTMSHGKWGVDCTIINISAPEGAMLRFCLPEIKEAEKKYVKTYLSSLTNLSMQL